ncbi:hypothetical protein [Natrinema salaciae]|uniref:Uncharacterized protein n=1 Tax=Natrinema salaciae TaxID=1186196 RepID=A0A1H9I6J6_9EURY|nr:hypothetical protein [Natrinema salaciae]SEQ70035.1 hypothetical protein SAMN04489841_2122 [Natrinema salaciae]
MQDVVLHTGASHPNLLWIVVPAVLSFIAGLGVVAYADRIRGWFRAESEPTTE